MRLTGKRVLIFAGPDFEDMELLYPRFRLLEEGASVTVAGIGEPHYKGKKGYPLDVDVQVTEVNARDFDALVIPGGYAPDKMRRVPELLQVVREMNEDAKPIAFICHAGWVPVSAGILKGKRITCVSAIKDDVINAGAEYVDEAVVVDGNLITSRTPDDLPVFMPKVIDAIAAG
ncbi:MAG: type 1 glutamine amidotransferase domain-containing protein [Actinomycetota bacterium]|nr:type 1 glutamine amidotransferase [Actinomycetota bacterium]